MIADYTAIVVALISLGGVIFQSLSNNKAIKRQNVKTELREIHEKLDAVSRGQEYVLQDRLMYLCQKYLDRGSVGTLELKLLTNMYQAYHNLGGNDFITDLFERVKELPIKG